MDHTYRTTAETAPTHPEFQGTLPIGYEVTGVYMVWNIDRRNGRRWMDAYQLRTEWS